MHSTICSFQHPFFSGADAKSLWKTVVNSDILIKICFEQQECHDLEYDLSVTSDFGKRSPAREGQDRE